MSMNYRTDLAVEAQELNKQKLPQGVTSEEQTLGEIKITRTKVTDKLAAEIMGKAPGNYITIEAPNFSQTVDPAEEQMEAMSKALSELLPEGLILVVGLGNTDITPDALGPLSVSGILATRHINGEVARQAGLEGLRPVAAVSPGVLGQTGMETGEIIASIVKEIKPAAVVAVDALASMSLSRLGTTIQISDTGISPGSGVGNTRKELSKDTLGIDCIAIGVPTVVDAATLAMDLMGEEEKPLNEDTRKKIEPRGASMMVTPREIDTLIKRAARIISRALNHALQPQISFDDMDLLTS